MDGGVSIEKARECSSAAALNYLRGKLEWSMGNGQCPECYGVHGGWLGHPFHPTPSSIGHEPDCQLARAICSLGGEVVYRGEYVPESVEASTCRNQLIRKPHETPLQPR